MMGFAFFLLWLGLDKVGIAVFITSIIDVGAIISGALFFLIVFVITQVLGGVQEKERQRQIALKILTPEQRILFEDIEARQIAVGWMA
jgi:hypothetical protein